MESIEQLKQDNAKLTERLNNAAKFFREQKAQIEALTKENEELKDQINRTPQEEVIDTEKWNALVTEKEDLNKQLNEYELKLQNLGTTISELKTKSENFEDVATNKQKVIEKLESDIDSKDKAYKVLQDTYNEVFAEKEKLKSEAINTKINTKVPELETKLNNANSAYEELRKKYAELKELHDGDLKRYNELEDNYESLQNKYKENDIAKGEAELKTENLQAEYVKKFEEQDDIIKSLKKENKETEEQFNKILNSYEKEITDLKSKNANTEQQLQDQTNSTKTLQDKFDKLNQAYDNCENEKLSWEADYHKLDEQYKSLTIQASVNKEVATKYEEIFEDYEKYKEFVNALFTKAKEVNIVWASPEELKDKDKQNTNKETKQPRKNQNVRMLNQEMNVQGGISINM